MAKIDLMTAIDEVLDEIDETYLRVLLEKQADTIHLKES